MKYLIIIFTKIFFNFIYLFIKIFPIQNKILFISRQTNKPSLDYRMIINKLPKNIKVVTITKRVEKNIKDAFKNNFLIMFKQMYHLATSKVCITDGYAPCISLLKHKKSLTIIQLWHSLGAIKKFGYQTYNYKMAKITNLHKNYNYIITGSKSMNKYFKKAFNYEENYLYPLGLPRIDYLLTKTKLNRNKILKKYPHLKNKKIVLYAPTFRENNNYHFEEIIKAFENTNFYLIIKPHLNTKQFINNSIEGFGTMQLLSVADYLITDYSAITIEASILNIPIFIWNFDIDSYKKYPGLNINLDNEFPGYVFKDINKLINKMKEKYNKEVINNFKNKYVVSTKIDVTDNIVKFILERMIK